MKLMSNCGQSRMGALRLRWIFIFIDRRPEIRFRGRLYRHQVFTRVTRMILKQFCVSATFCYHLFFRHLLFDEFFLQGSLRRIHYLQCDFSLLFVACPDFMQLLEGGRGALRLHYYLIDFLDKFDISSGHCLCLFHPLQWHPGPHNFFTLRLYFSHVLVFLCNRICGSNAPSRPLSHYIVEYLASFRVRKAPSMADRAALERDIVPFNRVAHDEGTLPKLVRVLG